MILQPLRENSSLFHLYHKASAPEFKVRSSSMDQVGCERCRRENLSSDGNENPSVWGKKPTTQTDNIKKI